MFHEGDGSPQSGPGFAQGLTYLTSDIHFTESPKNREFQGASLTLWQLINYLVEDRQSLVN